MNEQLRTDELEAGMKVRLPSPALLRTVAEVVPTPWVNHSDEPILKVCYLEGETPEWSAANTAIARSLWTIEVDPSAESIT